MSGWRPPPSTPTARRARGGAFLDEWRRRGEPAVVIAFVSGAVGTLRHELCHARFALDAEYRRWCEAAWAARVDALGKWLGALGYHATRRADEFGAYLLTEPAQFWRGRLGADEVRSLRAEPPAARHAAWIRAPGSRRRRRWQGRDRGGGCNVIEWLVMHSADADERAGVSRGILSERAREIVKARRARLRELVRAVAALQ